MVEIVGIRFKKVYKIYYFSPQGLAFKCGDHVIVETARGVEFGTVAIENRKISEDSITSPLKPVVRKATKEDEINYKKNIEKSKEAYKITVEKIAKHGLNMSPHKLLASSKGITVSIQWRNRVNTLMKSSKLISPMRGKGCPKKDTIISSGGYMISCFTCVQLLVTP